MASRAIFFVRSYDELGGPDNKTYYYKKDFIGSIAGLNFQYKINGKNAVFMGYERSINIGKKNDARRRLILFEHEQLGIYHNFD